MSVEWEYSVETLGGGLRGARPEDLEALLNEAAEEGWEFVNALQRVASGSQLLIILRRKVEDRPRDRSRTWP